MADISKNIALVMFQFSVVVKGIEKKLKDLGYHVDVISENFDIIKTCAPTVSTFLVYLPNDIMDPSKLRLLGKIEQMVSVAGRSMVLIGEANNHSDLMQALPELRSAEWLSRPVDMEKLGMVVEAVSGGEALGKASKRILIVDDDPSYAKMVREWIKSEYRVDIVTAGMQAITFLLKVPSDEKVDLILLDYEMPVVDGPQVLQMLRQDDVTKDIPVVFLTGLGTKEAVSRVMDLKPAGYVLKSTTRDNLLTYLKGKLQ